jgi:hypothetical protein
VSEHQRAVARCDELLAGRRLARVHGKENGVKKSKMQKAAEALITTALRPDSGDPAEREFAKSAFTTLYNASVRKGAINDWRLRLGK